MIRQFFKSVPKLTIKKLNNNDNIVDQHTTKNYKTKC